jgi:hypothetical protein
MIEFSDLTLRETQGDFEQIKRLMQKETTGDWMLRSDFFVSNPMSLPARYLLHFWKNGRVVIHDTDRPMVMGSSDEDLRELSNWCKVNGWGELVVDGRLLLTKQGFDYWQRAFRAGLVENERLQLYEDEEVERLTKAYIKEKKEEQEEEEEDNAP